MEAKYEPDLSLPSLRVIIETTNLPRVPDSEDYQHLMLTEDEHVAWNLVDCWSKGHLHPKMTVLDEMKLLPPDNIWSIHHIPVIHHTPVNDHEGKENHKTKEKSTSSSPPDININGSKPSTVDSPNSTPTMHGQI